MHMVALTPKLKKHAWELIGLQGGGYIVAIVGLACAESSGILGTPFFFVPRAAGP